MSSRCVDGQWTKGFPQCISKKPETEHVDSSIIDTNPFFTSLRGRLRPTQATTTERSTGTSKCLIPYNPYNRHCNNYRDGEYSNCKALGAGETWHSSHGSVALVACAPGSRRQDKSGTESQCLNGRWTKEYPRCEKYDTSFDRGGTDQTTQRTTTPISTIATEKREPSCTLPDYPHNVYSHHLDCRRSGCTAPRPGQPVPGGSIVLVSCESGYQMHNKNTVGVCKEGSWLSPIPPCYKLCDALKSSTLDLECWHGPTPVHCDQPQLTDTSVTFKCKPNHIPLFKNFRPKPQCQKNGRWSVDLPQCEPTCGVSDLNSAPLLPVIVDGKEVKTGNFPWHAAIFHRDDRTWKNSCGGSLLSGRVVLTAAHCVTVRSDKSQPDKMKEADLRVALGKNHREWDIRDSNEVRREVREIVVAPNYRGLPADYAEDLAVLVLEQVVVVNSFVMPVCFHQGRDKAVGEPNNGYVVGWGPVVDCGFNENCPNSDTLLYSSTPIMNYQECSDMIQNTKFTLNLRITSDKICSGNGSRSVVQKGDSGGGLVFPVGRHFYIYGVVSIRVKVRNGYSIGAFTNIYNHLKWLENTLTSVLRGTTG